MPRIKIVPSGTLNFASMLDSNSSRLDNIVSQISHAASRLNWSVKSKNNIDSSIQNVLNKSKSLSAELTSLSSYIKNATSRMIESDNSGARGIDKKYAKYKSNIAGINQKIYKNKIIGKKPLSKNTGDYYYDGEDGSGINRVYYLLDDDGAGFPIPFINKTILPQGHSALMLEKTNGGAIFYSWGTNQNAILNETPGILNRRDLSPDDFTQFKRTGNLPAHKGIEKIAEIPNRSYTRFLSVPVSEQSGKNMFSKAQEIFNGEGSYNRNDYKYNLTNNNCNQNAQVILGEAKLDFTLSGTPLKNMGAAAGAAQVFDDMLITAPASEMITDKLGVIPREAYDAGLKQWNNIDGFESGKFIKTSSGGRGW